MPDIPQPPLDGFEPFVQTHPVTVFEPAYRPKYKLSLLLFVITVISTLSVGAEYNYYYRINGPSDEVISALGHLMKQPSMLLSGLPFTLTLLGIPDRPRNGPFSGLPVLRDSRDPAVFHSFSEVSSGHWGHSFEFAHPLKIERLSLMSGSQDQLPDSLSPFLL